ncbi:lipase family protein [Stutzerimonas nitrititolerans]|uniref:lipase family protein n=1 Tax=Stutzerimonas nitrititolerans TaxID=2482751 RepID=UPI0028A0FA89|nr:lipase family protein [Stutzerimonas nitrititolerans]
MNRKAMEALACPLRNHKVSFRLVDEYGNGRPYAHLSYRLHDSQGQTFEGTLDSEGFAQVLNTHCGPLILDFSEKASQYLDPWYEELSIREAFPLPLTALQIAAEQSPSGPRRADGKTYLAEARAAHENAQLFRVEVSDFAEAKAHLPEPDTAWGPRPSAMLKLNAGVAQSRPGIALPSNNHHVLEVKALRAYNPLFSADKAFCAINAYHLAVMSVLAYAPFSKPKGFGVSYSSSPPPYNHPGSIGQVLREQLACLQKALVFNAARYDLLYEEVPYSKRLEVMPYDPSRYREEAAAGWNNPEDVHFLYDATETQAFITHNDKFVLISVRGTQEPWDFVADLDARQVPFEEGGGQAHRAFYKGFAAAKVFVERYLESFYSNQTLIICGHSLGGAIALLLSVWLKENWSKDIQLYTFGSPRAADRTFVQNATALTHHRLVNHNDPIPGVPFIWMDAEWKLATAGVVALFSSPALGISLLLGGLLNLQGDPYEHHGEQRHFLPRKPNSGSETAVLWQPGCAVIDEQACARYAGAINLRGDMPERDISKDLLLKNHSSDGGYSRAMLTTLLRWHSSVAERDGALFTPSEIQDLQAFIRRAEEELASWQPRNFAEFRHEVRKRHDRRFYNKTDTELMQLYSEGIAIARKLSDQQRAALARARDRLLNEADRKLTGRDVFGDLWQREDLPNLMAEWLALDANRNASKLAKLQAVPKPSFA